MGNNKWRTERITEPQKTDEQENKNGIGSNGG
jgi:hypothetical protein